MTARMVLRLSVIVQVSSFSSGRAAGAANVGGLPIEATQRRAEIVKHGGEVGRERGTTADKYIVTVRPYRTLIQPFHKFAKSAADTVAFGRGAGFFGDGEADADRTVIAAGAALQHKSRTVHPRPAGNGEEVRPLPQPIHGEIS